VTVAVRELAPAERAPAVPQVEVVVADDGHGFPPALRSSPFTATRRHESRSDGAGLGLSIADGIVNGHGGRIELMSTAVGTAFRIRLPVEAPHGHGVADAAAADRSDLRPQLTAGVRTSG
jgi:two-component system, NtrC family, sensor kinase